MTDILIPNIEDYRELENLDGCVFTFMTDRGRKDLSYGEYLNDTDLRNIIADTGRYTLILGRTIFSYPMAWLKQREHSRVAHHLQALEEERHSNPLRFFAPSGREALAFLNSDTDVSILTSCNRFGKTQSMLIKLMINSIPCDKNWEIFSKYGVKYIPWNGRVSAGVASYELDSHRKTILPMLLDWLPKKELGVYARDYKGKGSKQVNLNNDPKITLSCATDIGFYTTTQDQAKFESSYVKVWAWDEQGSREKFIGANERTRQVRDGKHFFGLTPHKIDGRPDTGAGGWIQDLVSGRTRFGLSVSMYHGKIWDVPDWILPEASKEKAFQQWVVEPMKNENDKDLREGRSRFFGEFHESSGLVIDEFDSKKHLIEPFEIPVHWPRFRGVDHASSTHPMGCLYAAISPANDLFIYDDYLRKGLSPKQNATNIVEKSGNQLNIIGKYQDPQSGFAYDRCEEIQCGTRFQWTVFDARAYSKKCDESLLTLSKLYAIHGLKMKQGSGSDCRTYVPILKDWFYVDKDKKHFATGELGAPKIYIFHTCKDFIRQFKSWTWEESKTRTSIRKVDMSPSKKDDDLCDCLKLIIQNKPVFRGGVLSGDKAYYDLEESEEKKLIVGRPVDRLSGY